MKLIFLIVICVIAYFVSWMLGPINSRPSIVAVNEAYFLVQRNQFLFTGFTVWLSACLYTYFVYKNILRAFFVVFCTGALCTVNNQLGDPSSIQYIGSALAEFMVPYLAAGVPPFVVLIAVTKYKNVRQAST